MQRPIAMGAAAVFNKAQVRSAWMGVIHPVGARGEARRGEGQDNDKQTSRQAVGAWQDTDTDGCLWTVGILHGHISCRPEWQRGHIPPATVFAAQRLGSSPIETSRAGKR
jgi:hypothetical protein